MRNSAGMRNSQFFAGGLTSYNCYTKMHVTVNGPDQRIYFLKILKIVAYDKTYCNMFDK